MRANTQKIFATFEKAGISKDKLPKPDEIEKAESGKKWDIKHSGYTGWILKRESNNYKIKLPGGPEVIIK